MKIDTTFFPGKDLAADAQHIQLAESLGFAAVWTSEAAHNPFFSLTIAAQKTKNILMGTQCAASFPRSPMVTAQIAWDLARQSNGRFILGLGTHLPSHIIRSMRDERADTPDRLREYIESLRAIWNTFQNGDRLRYRGQYYQFRLMAPFFNPGPIDCPEIPIYLSGATPEMCQLAGELCHGSHASFLHTKPYLQEVVLPSIAKGLTIAGRDGEKLALTVPTHVVSGTTSEAIQQSDKAARTHIAWHAAARTCQPFMERHGWDLIHDKLVRQASDGQWEDMWRTVTDDMLEQIAIVAEPQDIAAEIRERYQGIADRISLGLSRADHDLMEALAKAMLG